jgi:hypothetical protein
MVRVLVLAFSIFAVGTCVAAPMAIKCNAAEGGPFAQTLTVDLEGKSMKWGIVTYKIISMNAHYITGLDDASGVGGEIWVLDRETGEYWRASVFLGWPAAAITPEVLNGTKPRPPHSMQSATYHGQCNAPPEASLTPG